MTQTFSIQGSGIVSSGTLTLTSTADPAIFQITDISGNFSSTLGGFSGAITYFGLASNSPSSPSLYVNGTFQILYDNLFYPSAPSESCASGTTTTTLDNCGLAFYVGNTYVVNVSGSNVPGVFFLSDGNQKVIDEYLPVSFSTPAVLPQAATPEPSSFVLLGTGMLGLFSLMKRRIA